jgi:hypothetical protein
MPVNPATSISLCTLRLQCDTPSGTNVGTAFFYDYTLRHPDFHGGQPVTCPVLITNKHVAEGATAIETAITTYPTPAVPTDRGVMADEVTTAVRLEGADVGVVLHPDPNVDLCAISASEFIQRIPTGQLMRSVHLNASWMISAQEENYLRPIEPVVMIGYPNALWDAPHNRPVARRGLTASHPSLPWNSERQFVIDAACFPGSSGSPVFLFEDGMYRSSSSGYTPGTRARLLGILWGGPILTIEGRMVPREIPTTAHAVPVHDTMLNLGFVVHASALHDLKPLIEEASLRGAHKL